LKPDDLVRTWRLRSWKNKASDGSVVDPLGEDPVGYIFYPPDGYMSVEIMAAHREPYHDPDVFGGTADERSAAISTYRSMRVRSRCCPTRTP
jgi:Lipocalin-like domain